MDGSDSATRRLSGDWWTRERLGLLIPPVSLDGELLAPADR